MEITALTWDDVNFEDKTISVDKTAARVINRDKDADTKTKIIISSAKTERSARSIPMNKTVEKILLEQREQSRIFVFSSTNNTILMTRNLIRAFNSILKNANLSNNITIHSLRHTFATRLLEKDANIKVVSDILGHASIQITLDLYSHVMPNLKKDVISLLD